MKFDDIAWYLTPAEKARLKLKDPRPTLALYRIAHEGISMGAVVGLGRTPKHWSAEMIEQLKQKVGKNLPIYIGHPNGTTNRTPVGYVLKSFVKDTDAFAIVHFTDPMAAEQAERRMLDAASIEADLSLEQTPDGWEVAQVERVTALALEDEIHHTPGFSRAGLIAVTRELDDNPSPPDVESPVEDTTVELPLPPQPDLRVTIQHELRNKNLTTKECEFIHNRVAARVGNEFSEQQAKAEIYNSLTDLQEAKRIYRQPPQPVQVPAERHKGPFDYANPEHNELIPGD